MEKGENSDVALEKEVQRQFEIISFGTSEITPEHEFKAMLRHSLKTQTPLRIKCGIDPTGSDVHLGHLVPFKKMRQFQDLGHIGVVIIGDYTASIGDPTGKNEARPSLNPEVIQTNAREYMRQLYTVLDEEKTEVQFQSEWFADIGLKDVIGWTAQTTVAKLLAHETFRERLDQGHVLSLHELFYPILQGIDSVYVKADVELGGTDQKFNVLMGRDYQKNAEQRPQAAILLPIIIGTCGTQKMSKSLNNYIGILDEPFDKFGKIMSIPDNLMFEYFQYVLGVGQSELDEIKVGLANSTLHPNVTKKDLAKRVVAFFHGADIGATMLEQFESVFKKKNMPDEVPEFHFKRNDQLVSILVAADILESKGEARRLIKQKAIGLVGGEKIQNTEAIIDESFTGKVIKIGKRKFLRLL